MTVEPAMRAVVALLATLLTIAAAGCVESPPVVDPPIEEVVNSLEGYVDPFIMNHDHADVSTHKLLFHTKQLAHHPLGGTNLQSSGAHVVDVRGDWLFVGAYGFAAGNEGGVYIFSLEDPKEPELTGVFALPGNLGGDRSMEATDDGNWVVFGTESSDCANHVAPVRPGLFLIDARDKANPKEAHYIPDSGVHSVVVHSINGEDYAITTGGTDVSRGQNIWRINKEAGQLEAIGSVPMSHDGAAFNDPILGTPILYSADTANLKVYDWSDPASPVELGSWAPSVVKDAAGKYVNYVHAVTMDIIEGRRILVTESENWQDQPSPVWILDATDFGAIELIGNWSNPADAPAHAGDEDGTSLAFSTHNPRLENGTLYLAHYHGGAWILDLRTLAKATAPEIMGYFLPHEDNGGYKAGSSQSVLPFPPNPACVYTYGVFELNEMPLVMDLEVRNGIVYAADVHTGLYTFEYDPSVWAMLGHSH